MFNRIYKLGVKTKITITIFLILLLFSSGIIYIIKSSLSTKIHSLASNTAKDIIKVNEAFIIKSLLEDDTWSVYKFLNSLTKINLIKSAGFVDNNNTILAHTNTKDYPQNKGFKKSYLKGDNMIIIPLLSNSVHLGKFIIEIDKVSLSLLFADLKAHLLVFVILATFISFFIAYLISNRILNRLNILSFNAKMIQKKEYEKIKKIDTKEQDEITLFQNSMELILTKLKDSIENEKTLRKFYHDILESLDEFIVLCDYKFNILYENAHSLSQLIVKNSTIEKNILKELQNNIFNNNHNFVITTENDEGATISLFVIVKKLEDTLAISFSNITLLRLLQEKQCISNSFEIVGEISSSVVHEIKNHLQPVKLLIEQEQMDKEDQKRVINIIAKIDLMVNEFLKAGRPIDKLMAVQIDVNEKIDSTIHLIKKQLEDKKINIIKTIQKDMKIFISEKSFETIILNLLKNGIDESKYNDSILIDAFIKNGHGVIEITDFGKGIDKQTLKNIHKPFFTTKGEKGSGIGLYTTYKIVYMYNGYIDVKSKVGKTVFSIHLPIKEKHEHSNY